MRKCFVHVFLNFGGLVSTFWQILAAVRDCLAQQCALAGIFSEKDIVLMAITFKSAWPFACSARFRCRQLPMHLPLLKMTATLPLWRLPGVCESHVPHPKRKQPQYKPRPVLPVLGDEQEAHVLPLPKRAARVTQPQKAKRSVFQS